MRVAVFTSLNSAYLPNGRVLARSVSEHHPEWDFFLLFNDRTPTDVHWHEEPFDEVFFAEWLPIGRAWRPWAFRHSIVEFCTATKGPMAEYLLHGRNYDAVIYLDPDTVVFSRLEEIISLFESGSEVILTPHLTDAEFTAEGIWSHEMAALKHGTFNLGFFAIAKRENGVRFLRWWAERLLDYCRIDFDQGLFTDQKWCNLAPYMFDGIHVLRDRAYNVATWNMRNRRITVSEAGEWLVNGSPLRFYHFSGFGNDFAWADRELEHFAKDHPGHRQLWADYRLRMQRNTVADAGTDWFWGKTDDGRPITAELRQDSAHHLDPYDIRAG